MSRIPHRVLLITVALLVSCSGDSDPPEDRPARGDHVWKDQVQAYDKARQVEDMLNKAAEQNKRHLEQQTQ